jgi:hypothetical protein
MGPSSSGIPRHERRRDAGAEADRLVVAERRVVREAGLRLRRPRGAHVEAQEVLADAGHRGARRRRGRDRLTLARELASVAVALVAAVQADLVAAPRHVGDQVFHSDAATVVADDVAEPVERIVLVTLRGSGQK